MKRNLWHWLIMVFIFTLVISIIACGGSDNSSRNNSNSSTAANWISMGKTSTGDLYYNNNSLKKVNNNIISVETKKILIEDIKTKSFLSSTGIDNAVKNPDLISYISVLNEIDCVTKKVKPVSSNTKYNNWDNYVPDSDTRYNDWDNITPNSVTKYGEWYNINRNSVAEKLEQIVCMEPATPQKNIFATKVKEPVATKEVVVTVAVPAVTNKNLSQVNSKQKDEVQILVNKWLTSWQSGDMKTYRSCYASDFLSKGKKLNDWISYRTELYKESKKINISIDNLQISADANIATAVFIQHYSSSTTKVSGKKTLELRKVNNRWEIYREII